MRIGPPHRQLPNAWSTQQRMARQLHSAWGASDRLSNPCGHHPVPLRLDAIPVPAPKRIGVARGFAQQQVEPVLVELVGAPKHGEGVVLGRVAEPLP